MTKLGPWKVHKVPLIQHLFAVKTKLIWLSRFTASENCPDWDYYSRNEFIVRNHPSPFCWCNLKSYSAAHFSISLMKKHNMGTMIRTCFGSGVDRTLPISNEKEFPQYKKVLYKRLIICLVYREKKEKVCC